ncbi:MAG: hypothetical protein MJZ74_00545 [Muribaculaceae bacterium]|nr:hypothetical protein [Muribaculaceae bacterium]
MINYFDFSLKGIQEFSPQSDVYSLAATLFCLLTDDTPPGASEWGYPHVSWR